MAVGVICVIEIAGAILSPNFVTQVLPDVTLFCVHVIKLPLCQRPISRTKNKTTNKAGAPHMSKRDGAGMRLRLQWGQITRLDEARWPQRRQRICLERARKNSPHVGQTDVPGAIAALQFGQRPMLAAARTAGKLLTAGNNLVLFAGFSLSLL